MAPVVQQIYEQMAELTLLIACASSGEWYFDTYSVLGIDKVIAGGCVQVVPPRAEQIIDGFMKIQELVGNEPLRRGVQSGMQSHAGDQNR